MKDEGKGGGGGGVFPHALLHHGSTKEWLLTAILLSSKITKFAFSETKRNYRLVFRRPLVFGLSSPRRECFRGGARAHFRNSGW